MKYVHICDNYNSHFGCQLEPKVLDGHLGAFACVVLHWDETIGDGYIK